MEIVGRSIGRDRFLHLRRHLRRCGEQRHQPLFMLPQFAVRHLHAPARVAGQTHAIDHDRHREQGERRKQNQRQQVTLHENLTVGGWATSASGTSKNSRRSIWWKSATMFEGTDIKRFR